MAEALDAIASSGVDQKTKVEKYTEALAAAMSSQSAPACKAFVEHSAHPAPPR
jgi:hypothetical protein